MERISLHKHLSLHSSNQISLTVMLDFILPHVAWKSSGLLDINMMIRIFNIHLTDPTFDTVSVFNHAVIFILREELLPIFDGFDFFYIHVLHKKLGSSNST